MPFRSVTSTRQIVLCLLTLIATLLPQLLPSIFPSLITNALSDPLYAAPSIQNDENNDDPFMAYRISDANSTIQIKWTVPTSIDSGIQRSFIQAALKNMPEAAHRGYNLPLQRELVLLTDETASAPRIRQLDSIPWELPPLFEPPSPPAIGWEEEFEPPILKPAELPESPLFILHEGRVRGHRVAVLATSPIYQQNGEPRLAMRIDAYMNGATRLVGRVDSLFETNPDQTGTALLPPGTALLPAGTARLPDGSPEARTNSILAPGSPPNPRALGQATKVHIATSGLQEISGVNLINVGTPAGTTLATLQLFSSEVEIPLEIRDADGILDESTILRFYVGHPEHSEQPGDRWNREVIYWLVIGSNAGLRMTRRDVSPQGAPIRLEGVEKGIWEQNNLYESTMSGIDGDHWFSHKMNSDPTQINQPQSWATAVIPIQHNLPLATWSLAKSTFSITGSARTISPHKLRILLGSEEQVVTWETQDYYEDWQFDIQSTRHTDTLNVTQIPGLIPSGLRVDKVYWEQPVHLDFGGNGAEFTGVDGTWRYELRNLPANGTIYDVTDAYRPSVLTMPQQAPSLLQDGPFARDYLVASDNNISQPRLSHHAPIGLHTLQGADAIYIAPSYFHDELEPLLTHRRNQGYQVVVIDVQEIYDGWSDGMVSAQAIRALLQYAVQQWQPAPKSVVLVGDSTTDPLNYLGTQNGQVNANIVPAYLADVDPWIGETACENCFVQLDGIDPLDPVADPGFLIDMWLGRFSAQTEEQLAAIVKKIVLYETAPSYGLDEEWRYSSLYLADNYIHANGSVDAAGNFASLSDLIIEGDPALGRSALQPAGMIANRVYYDPSPFGIEEPWREPDANTARLRTIEQFQQGPGLVTYNGHAHTFQWASTDITADKPYLFNKADIQELQNLDRLSFVLELTCYTGQFTYVSSTGTTLDEELLRYPDGGAVGVWGSAGLTIAYGHDAMVHGFHNQLWSSPPMTARLGELTEAGYLALFQRSGCCQEARRVYLLQGDPLTPLRIWAPQLQYLPYTVSNHQP